MWFKKRTLSFTSSLFWGVAMATTDKRRFALTGATRTVVEVENEVTEAAAGAAKTAADDMAMVREAIAEAAETQIATKNSEKWLDRSKRNCRKIFDGKGKNAARWR